MKQIYTLTVGILLTGALAAQSLSFKLPANQRQSAKYNPITGAAVNSGTAVKVKPPYLASESKMLTQIEEYVGTSIYDLQSNNSVQNRIVADDAGVSACFTFSATNSGDTYPDRGTGYNYRMAGVWQDDITQRIETMRTGWPSLMHLGNGGEVVMNHSGSGGIKVWSRSTIGTGNWIGSAVPNPSSFVMFWPRAVAGGADGNSIHMVCLADPNAGAYTNGMVGPLLYNRSTDGGLTWDLTEVLLPNEDTAIVSGFSADTYAIHARGNKIAIAAFGDLQDSYVWISEDNGNTWNQRIAWDFPIDNYEIDMGTDVGLDGIQDTILSSDGAGAVFIDASNTVHAAFGTMFYTDDLGVIDSVYSYFPLAGSIAYWNENMVDPANEVLEIGTSIDIDPAIPAGITEIGQYGNSGTASHPQLAEAADGTIFCSFQAVNEAYYNGAEYLRHIYAVKSSDGGATWTTPSDITPDIAEDGYEYVYASMAPDAYGDKIHLIVQRDFEPGIHVQPEDAADPVTDNDHIYVCVSLDLVQVEEGGVENHLSVFPNPSNGNLQINLPVSESGVVSIFNMNGQLVWSTNTNQVNKLTLDISHLPNGVYNVSYTSDSNTWNTSIVKN
ncbi:MAG: T9SS type A sorting domain-containing protein [Bacteroidota bacterium]